MRMEVDGTAFDIVLEDNPTAEGLAGMLPLELRMTELNGNEKYCDLGRTLPEDGSCPGSIRAGDLMLYRDSCLVVFYRSFRTGYSYTRVGRVADASGLAEALGRGDVDVRFS